MKKIIKKIESENDLRDSLINHLKNQGIKEIVTEVNITPGWSIVDLIYIDDSRGFICVELKLRAWEKVLEQALRIKCLTSFVYIAMPRFKTAYKRKQVEAEAKSKGIGVMWFSEKGFWYSVKHPFKVHRDEGILDHYLPERMFDSIHMTFLTKCINHGKAKSECQESLRLGDNL